MAFYFTLNKGEYTNQITMAKRLGNQIPTRSKVLKYSKTEQKQAIELYEKTGRKAQKWQKLLIKDILAFNSKKLWVHTKFGYSLPRRNGKNEIAAIRELWGLMNGEKILHTAHRTTTSHAAWERLLNLLDLSKIEYESLRAIGRERIELATGGRIEFRTRSTKGGLGEGFDLLIIDEAQEYTDDQESALKYVVTDSKNPQTLFCGTPPTPLSSGTVFTNLREKVFDGAVENAGWAEWSVDELSDTRNKDLWYLTNPSLGTIFTERSVQDEIGADDIDFNIQRLGLWLKYNQKSAISETEWNDLKVDNWTANINGKLFVGIKYGHDGTNVAMSVAVKTNDDRIFIESIDCQSVRNGNDWILNFLHQAHVQSVAVDGASGQQLLSAAMKDARLRLPILPTVKEIIRANSSFEQAIFNQTICHNGQPSLIQVVSNCEKRPIGSNGGFGYKSQIEENDIALLDSVILAHWLCSESKAPIKQKIAY